MGPADVRWSTRLTIVGVGDSITQQGTAQEGWMTLLAHHYTRRADVINRGYSGYNSRDMALLLRKHMHASVRAWPYDPLSMHDHSSPVFVTLFLGANDASLPGSRSGAQHVPIDAYVKHMTEVSGYGMDGMGWEMTHT